MSKQQKKQSENLPVLSKPRLPYHPVIKEEFGYDENAWKALVEAIFPAAKTPEAVRLALSYCKARNLDPFKRCVHIVPIWDSKKRCEVDTIWPGIGELRTTAHRTQVYAGRDKTEFGEMITKKWGKLEVVFPEWAQVTVYRIVKDQRVAYAGPQVYWLETFGSRKEGNPNSMWARRPRGMIDKCAEAAALRAAFPEEIGNDYIDAEAHPSAVQAKSFEEKVEDNKGRIDEEQGKKEVVTEFEKPEDKKAESGGKKKEKDAPKFLYVCKKCGIGFNEPKIAGSGNTQVPMCPDLKCCSKNIEATENKEAFLED